MNYYQIKEWVSCSDLKRAMRKAKNQPEPDWANMPSIKFGSDVDEALTGEYKGDDKKVLDLYSLYLDKTKTPYPGIFQHEFYRSLKLEFNSVSYDLKMRGKTDIHYPDLRIVEDIKTTSIKTLSQNSIANYIDRFDCDMQIVIYMTLSRSNLGVLSILSHTGFWLHQVYIKKDSPLYNSGLVKLERHLKNWFSS